MVTVCNGNHADFRAAGGQQRNSAEPVEAVWRFEV
jgi:hypothetical protein